MNIKASYHKNSNKYLKGFTLVELSVVLVIIGFIIAGIAGGSSLIKSAQLNSVINDFRKYDTAYINFISRYLHITGDYNNGYAIWGSACADSASNCNGDQNGYIDSTREVQAAWIMLSQAGMVSVVAQPLATSLLPANLETNMPASKVSGAGFMIAQGAEYLSGVNQVFTGNTGLWAQGSGNITPINAVFLAKPDNTSTMLTNSALTPVDAFSIDTKLDDGVAALGAVRAGNGNDGTNGVTGCINTGNGIYNLSNNQVSCFIAMNMNQ